MLENHQRPTWDEYFMEVANAIAKRWTCDRARLGCVIAKDKQIIVTGYNWAPPKFPHCDQVWHLMKKHIDEEWNVSQHCERTIHAEQNAICQAAKRWVSVDWATLYCQVTPCYRCAMLIIACGIKRVVCAKKYHKWEESEKMFEQAGILLEFFDDEILKYENQ